METKSYRLGDIVEVVDTLHATAPTVQQKTPYRMIRTANVRNGQLDTEAMKCVEPEVYQKWTRRGTLEVGDVILTREAPMGEVGVIRRTDVRYFLGQRTLRLRPTSEELSSEFLYFYLQGPQMQRQIGFNEGTGATVSNIRIPVLLDMRMELPSRRVQDEIVQILGGIQEKFELNKRINRTLLRLVDSLYLLHYVDDVDKLNVDSVPLSSIVRTKTKTFNPRKSSEELVNHFSMPAFDRSQFPTVDPVETIKSNKNVVEPLSVLVSKMNPRVKRVWLPNVSESLLNVVSTEFLTFIADSNEMQAFIFSLVNSDAYQQFLISNTTGSTNSRQRVLPRVAYSYQIPYDEAKAMALGRELSPIVERIKVNKAQNQSLSALHDLLLPKLLSGSMDLSALEEAM